jgi:AcrR family transcriptional regulator
MEHSGLVTNRLRTLYYVQSTTYIMLVVVVSARTSAGDPARTLELLWRRSSDGQAGHGPKRGLSLDQIVYQAIAVADAEGLDAVTMRRLAQTLGVVPMTLYTYVPGKAELLDLMLDTVYGQMELKDAGVAMRPDAGDGAHGAWRRRLEAIADANRALFKAHPWAATISTVRPPLGPGLMAKYERELRALEGLGLTDVEMDSTLTLLLGFVRSCALAEAEMQAATRESGKDDRQWWEANAPLLARVLDEKAYPTAARVGTAAGAAHGATYSPDHAYVFGLARMLDGIEELIEKRSRP